ncbi:MAG: energy-coupling factor transporter ATPase [Oscillospiraceae bacterium]|nr:energy-coupling factor transporter ATPase [Oscillospiraceae bacterium]
MSTLSTENLSHSYSIGTPFEQQAIRRISLNIGQGEFVFLMGHTGSGKSTFVQHLNALLQPTEGRVLFNGEDINRDKSARRNVKKHVGLVFQYPEYQLFEETVAGDIAFGPKNIGVPASELPDRIREAAEFTGISEELFSRSPLELSGGQKRRIAIAGVIAMHPEILILDEPTAGLDPAGGRKIMENVCRYQEKTGASIVVVSHSMDEAAIYGRRLIVFNQGEVYMDGSPEEVFSRSDELSSFGLDVPQAAKLAEALRNRGLSVPKSVYTYEQLLRAVREVLGC